MSAELRLIHNSGIEENNNLNFMPPFIGTLFSQIIGVNATIETQEFYQLPDQELAWFGFCSNTESFKLGLKSNLLGDINNYFETLCKLADSISTYFKDQLYIISPQKCRPDDIIKSYRLRLKTEDHAWQGEQIFLAGHTPEKLLLEMYSEQLGQTLAKFAGQRSKLELVASLDKELKKPATFWLSSKTDRYSIKIYQTTGGYSMEIQKELNQIEEKETQKVVLDIVLGEVVLAFDDFVKLKPGAVIEIKTDAPLAGILQFPDGGKVAEVTLEFEGEEVRLQVKELFL